MSSPTPPLLAISDADEVRPAAPRSCSETSSSRSSSSRQHSSSFFSANGSPIWTDGRLASSPSPSSALASTEAPPIPSRPVSAPSSTSTLPGPGRGAADQPLVRRQPEAHRVDQAVLLVAVLEVDLAADRRHADRVAVVADPGDGAARAGSASAPSVRRLAEAQRVEHRDRPGADREHVAQDPADAGGRALERLDRARVVVRLDLEGDRQAVADVDRAGVLARAHQHVRALGRQPAQQLASSACRRSARTTSATASPARRRSARARAGRRSARTRRRSARAARWRASERGRASPTCARIDSKIVRPSAEPVSGSTACSGWGIRPNTLPALVAHAGDVAQRAVRVLARGVAQQHLAGGLEPVELGVGRVEAAGRVLDRDRQPLAGRRTRAVNGVSASTTSSSTWRKTNFSEVLGSSAPGSSPASHRTWKPLQIPSTSPPSRANSATSSITGANRAIAPARR